MIDCHVDAWPHRLSASSYGACNRAGCAWGHVPGADVENTQEEAFKAWTVATRKKGLMVPLGDHDRLRERTISAVVAASLLAFIRRQDRIKNGPSAYRSVPAS